MKKINFELLIRDRVPAIIEKSGRNVIVEQASPSEFKELLHFKLNEVLSHYDSSHDILDLIKVIDVVEALAKLEGYSEEDVLKIREDIVKKKGSYDKRLVLKEINYE